MYKNVDSCTRMFGMRMKFRQNNLCYKLKSQKSYQAIDFPDFCV